MKPYLSQIRMTLRLSLRDRTVLFFNYIFPLFFFFLFGQIFHAREGGMTQVVSIVLTIGILGTGLMGAGLRAAMDREQNILRRFKVAPITAAPILVSSMATGLAQYIPQAAIVIFLARTIYKMPSIEHSGSLFLFLALGVLAFRAIGGIVAAVVNSMQESQIIVQLLYMPMLLLGGVIPVSVMPNWLQTLSQFVPSTHLATGMQAILLDRGTLRENLPATGALALTAIVGTFLGVKLFRWEKEEKMRPAAKLWLVVVFTPFLLIGLWQLRAKDTVARQKILARDLQRKGTWLIHDARLFIGDGRLVERGSVLVRDGKIARLFVGDSPDPKTLDATVIEGAGKTLLPGLIDVHVHLGANGGISESAYTKQTGGIDRELAAYLYSGATAVKSAGDPLDTILEARKQANSGEKLAAELFIVGPLFTTEEGHGTEILKSVPDNIRRRIEPQFLRLPHTPEEAKTQVAELRKQGVDGIKAVLEAGGGNVRFHRMDPNILKAIGDAAHEAGLPLVVHTGDAQDVADALDSRAAGIEHGSFRDQIPDALFARMSRDGVAYDPTLTVVESIAALEQGSSAPIQRTLVQQSAPPGLLASIQAAITSSEFQSMRAAYKAGVPVSLEQGMKNLIAARRGGVILVTGTDSGNPLTLHGPGVHREMQLWVQAGIAPTDALQAATHNAARLLGAGTRIGLVQEGYEASLLLVDGNPLQDISVTERISALLFKGERIDRMDLFEKP
jgi:imidazolonepropionase-like amidohydrolase/ABC-type multidrug transport system permease subunit